MVGRPCRRACMPAHGQRPPRVYGSRSAEMLVHQVETSLDFAPGNSVPMWYLRGLNYQAEHHLFPRVCHLHLRHLSTLVEAACLEYGVNYRVHPTAHAALALHARWVHRFGQLPAEVA